MKNNEKYGGKKHKWMALMGKSSIKWPGITLTRQFRDTSTRLARSRASSWGLPWQIRIRRVNWKQIILSIYGWITIWISKYHYIVLSIYIYIHTVYIYTHGSWYMDSPIFFREIMDKNYYKVIAMNGSWKWYSQLPDLDLLCWHWTSDNE